MAVIQLQLQILTIGIAIGLGGALAAQSTQPAATAPTSRPAASQPRRQLTDPRILWTVNTDAPSFGSGAAGDIDGDGKPEIVFGTYFNDSHLYAVNAEDGSLLWKYPSSGGPIDASVLLCDVNGDGTPEIIFADSAYGIIYCLNGAGDKLWIYKSQSGTDSPIAAADLDGNGTIELVYGTMKDGASNNGHVNVLRGANGSMVWSVEVPGHIQSEPGLVDLNGDGTLDVLVNTWQGDNKLHALNGKDGSTLWTFDTDDWIYHGVSFFDFDHDSKPEIVVANRKGSVWMLQGESGAPAWHTTLEGEKPGMVFAPTSLVDVDRDGTPEIAVCGEHLHLLDAKDGKVRWRNTYGGRSIARGVAVADLDGDGVDDLVFGEKTTLRAVRSDTGAELWAVDLHQTDDFFEHIDNAPLILDADGDGTLDVFVVSGRGLSNETQKDNFGIAVLVRGGVRKPESAAVGASPPTATDGWRMFRGGPRHSGTSSVKPK